MPPIDAVVPLVPRDLPRFRLLARSLTRYLSDLQTLFVVVPDAAMAAVRDELSRASGLPTRLVAESEWLPGLDALPLRGWYKQQLVKLAASAHVKSDFFLTLDADVICTRNCNYSSLVPEGKAGCYVMQQADHQDWYDGAEAALGLKAVRRGVLHNVTPVVWSTEGVQQTVSHLNQRARARQWASGLRGLRQRVRSLLSADPTLPAWVRYLGSATPWAEYALYFTYLEATGQFERYHVETRSCIYDIERSLWKNTKTLVGWDPSPLFNGEGPPFFAVLQSNAELPVDELWRCLQPWLGAP